MEPGKLKDAGGQRTVTTTARGMGDERWGGASLFIPYWSNDVGSQVRPKMHDNETVYIKFLNV